MDEYRINDGPIAHLIEGELAPLLHAYYDELVVRPAMSTFDAHRLAATYTQLEQAGLMHTTRLWHGDRVVGLVSMLDYTSTHFGYRTCGNELLYVQPQHRKGRLAMRLLDAAEVSAKARGVQVVLWGTQFGTPAARLFALRGYRVQDVFYAKEL